MLTSKILTSLQKVNKTARGGDHYLGSILDVTQLRRMRQWQGTNTIETLLKVGWPTCLPLGAPPIDARVLQPWRFPKLLRHLLKMRIMIICSKTSEILWRVYVPEVEMRTKQYLISGNSASNNRQQTFKMIEVIRTWIWQASSLVGANTKTIGPSPRWNTNIWFSIVSHFNSILHKTTFR